MREVIIKAYEKLPLRTLLGGPLGCLAWSISSASAIAIAIWGLEAVALPLLMLKTASWGIWGVGIARQSRDAKLRSRNS
jgi:hypothetical protein